MDRRCQDLMQEVKLSRERQEVLTGMVVSKRDMQKEAPQEVSRKGFRGAKGKRSSGTRAKEAHAHQVGRERARILHRLRGSRATRHWNDARDIVSVESCSPSMACDMEEVGSESSRKIRDKEETTSEASWTAVTKGKEKVWRLEPEGEAERPEATAPWSGVNGVSVNLEGESRLG